MSFLDNIDTSVLDGILASSAPKAAAIVTCTIEGLVTEADLAEYCHAVLMGDLPGPNKANDTDLQKLRARHHSVARLLATGVPETVVALITHYHPTRISQFKNSPAMQELIAHYRGPGNEAHQALKEKLRVLGEGSVDELCRRIEEAPEDLTASELTALAKLGMDRSDHGPTSKVDVNSRNEVIDHAKLLELKMSVREAERGRITRAQPLLPARTEDERDVDAA